MCGPDKFPRFLLEAAATRHCNQGHEHEGEKHLQYYEHAHDLYRAAKDFFRKNGDAHIKMTISIAPESPPAEKAGEAA